MSQGRILPLLGPAVVLYLLAEVAASGAELDAVSLTLAGLALLGAAAPLRLLRRDPQPGARRVAIASALAGVALVRWVHPELASMYLDLASAAALPALGLALLHLAATTPDRPGPLARRRRLPTLLAGLGALVGVVGSGLAAGPPLRFGDEPVLVPAAWVHAAAGYLIVALLVALVLRILRRRLGSTPEALASGLWAQLGLTSALAHAGVVALLLSRGVEPSAVVVRALLASGLGTLIAGHVAMLGSRRQVHAGRSTRRLLAAGLTLGVLAGGAATFADRLPRDPLAVGAAATAVLGLGALLHRLLTLGLHRLLTPFRGRLLSAVEATGEVAVALTSLEELGACVLPPLRRASGALDAEPLLFTLDPPRQVRVDAAGIAHVSEATASPALVERLRAHPGEIVVRAPLVEQVVRRPELRVLAEALERADALCVIPLSREQELEGLLVVPRGRRRGTVTLEELHALERLGRHVAAQVALLTAQERARLRTSEAIAARDALEEELEAAEEELLRVRADARVLKAGGAPARFAPPLIAYSAAMRGLMRRLEEVASVDAPLLLLGEDGTALDQVGHHVHACGGRREGPFVVAECAAVRPERADAALFGETADGRPGWLRLAEGGTCLLLDVPALSLEAQAKLAEAIATRRTSPADGAGSHPLDVRIVATSRVPLGPLVEAGLFDPELHRRLEPLVLEVPPLRERREDVPSLVLLALDRSCRTSGRPVLGIDADALEALRAHPWPGNLRELGSAIDRAVLRAAGPTVGRADLPPLAPVEEGPDPWSGTFAELELRILEQALARAQGNKSEAARLLGLKRSTFLDKLKRCEVPADPKKHGAQGTAA